MGHSKQGKAMVTREEIEGFLDKLAAEGTSYSEIQPGLWIVKPTGSFSFDVVVNYSLPGRRASREGHGAADGPEGTGDAQPPAPRAQRNGARARIVWDRAGFDRPHGGARA